MHGEWFKNTRAGSPAVKKMPDRQGIICVDCQVITKDRTVCSVKIIPDQVAI